MMFDKNLKREATHFCGREETGNFVVIAPRQVAVQKKVLGTITLDQLVITDQLEVKYIIEL